MSAVWMRLRFANGSAPVNAENIGCRRKRNGNTPPKAPTGGDIPGATLISAAISPILPTKTLLSLGATARSTMGMPRVRRLGYFPAEPARSGSKIWREMSGNGAAISLSNTNQRPKPIRTDPRVKPNAFIAAAVGNRASPVCRRPRAAPTSRISPATILVSESSASAKAKGFLPINEKRGSPPRSRNQYGDLPLAVWIEPKLGPAAFGVGFGFTPALLIRCLKRAQASHFIEHAFHVQLAFQPLERAIHWFAFSNNDFWHQFTSIPKNSPIPTLTKPNLLRPSPPRQIPRRGRPRCPILTADYAD